MQLDKRQEELLKTIEQFITHIPINIKDKTISLFKNLLSTKKGAGIYIYGGVGRGKTMIVKKALESATKINIKIVHFQQFMQDVHKAVHLLRKDTDQVFILHKFVESYSRNIQLLFIDELEVKDIADAMILLELVAEFIEQDTKIIFTSNTRPGDLYKDGMQREFFMPFIDMVEESFCLFHLDRETDYRKIGITSLKNKFFFGANVSQLDKIIKDLKIEQDFKVSNIVVYGRNVVFQRTMGGTLVTDFYELFEQNFSSADYIEICKSFKVIIVSNIRHIDKLETDIAIRFINFIDNAYVNHVILFCSFLQNLDEIYPIGKRASEFQRTISRLCEMNSDGYSS